MRRLQLDEDERDAVDEAEEVGPPLVQVALDPELGDEEEVVVARVVPVDDGQPLGLLAAVRLANGDRDAVAQQLIDLAVRPRVVESAAVPGDLGDRLVDRVAPAPLGSAVRARRAAAASRKTSFRLSRPSVPSAPSFSWYALTWSQPSSPNSSMAGFSTAASSVYGRGMTLTPPPPRRRCRGLSTSISPETSLGRSRSRDLAQVRTIW